MAGTTFEKYGGFSTVSRIVLDFYDRVLDSEDVGYHFDNIDMSRLVDHQTKFIASTLGGPIAVSDERLRHVHHQIDISNAQFDEIVLLLSEALRDHGMSNQDIMAVKGDIEAKRHLIVRKGAA